MALGVRCRRTRSMLTCVQLALQSSSAQSRHQAVASAHACTAQAATPCFRLQQSFVGDSQVLRGLCAAASSTVLSPCSLLYANQVRGTHLAHTGSSSEHCASSRQPPTLAIQMLAIFVKPYTVQPSRSPFLL